MGIEFDTSGLDDLMDDLNHLSFDIECPNCNHSIAVSVDDVGKTVTCPHCNTGVAIESE